MSTLSADFLPGLRPRLPDSLRWEPSCNKEKHPNRKKITLVVNINNFFENGIKKLPQYLRRQFFPKRNKNIAMKSKLTKVQSNLRIMDSKACDCVNYSCTYTNTHLLRTFLSYTYFNTLNWLHLLVPWILLSNNVYIVFGIKAG